MSSIITNPVVGQQMSDLEARARAGCPIAQNELYKQCMGFAEAVMDDQKTGADMKVRDELITK